MGLVQVLNLTVDLALRYKLSLHSLHLLSQLLLLLCRAVILALQLVMLLLQLLTKLLLSVQLLLQLALKLLLLLPFLFPHFLGLSMSLVHALNPAVDLVLGYKLSLHFGDLL